MAQLRQLSDDARLVTPDDLPATPGDAGPSPDQTAPVGVAVPGDSIGGHGQSSESPRERVTQGTGGQAPTEPPAITSAPRRPDVPTPQAGLASPAMDASMGVIPFTPLSGPDPVSQVRPRTPALYGSLGGLAGGGLGLPQDPTSRAANPTIDGLIQLIQRLQQGQ